jgi:hypothetical protein
MPVVVGILAGSVVLVAVYIAINRFGVRLPLKPFFAVTSAFLYYMAFVFAGKGVAELQEGGLIGTTILSWAPRAPALGIYPTAESLGAQAVLLGLAAIALGWNFLIEPRRLRGVTSVMVPETPTRAATPPTLSAAGADTVGPAAVLELRRSLERMEADLAEMRAEVERMRRHLPVDRPVSSERPPR